MPPRKQKTLLFTKSGVPYALGAPTHTCGTAREVATSPPVVPHQKTCVTYACRRLASGDTALLKSNEALPYVAEIQGIQFDKKGLLHVKCGWYFRPEDLDGGRKSWHGQQELFRSSLTGTSAAWTESSSIRLKLASCLCCHLPQTSTQSSQSCNAWRSWTWTRTSGWLTALKPRRSRMPCTTIGSRMT